LFIGSLAHLSSITWPGGQKLIVTGYLLLVSIS
jgi:hypothetical protein